MSALHKAAGAKGGQETKKLYGVEFFAQCGSEGGRPTWQEELEKDRLGRDQAKRNAKHK